MTKLMSCVTFSEGKKYPRQSPQAVKPWAFDPDADAHLGDHPFRSVLLSTSTSLHSLSPYQALRKYLRVGLSPPFRRGSKWSMSNPLSSGHICAETLRQPQRLVRPWRASHPTKTGTLKNKCLCQVCGVPSRFDVIYTT